MVFHHRTGSLAVQLCEAADSTYREDFGQEEAHMDSAVLS
jgi:hypothetical protein